jgi:hypothetical protein
VSELYADVEVDGHVRAAAEQMKGGQHVRLVRHGDRQREHAVQRVRPDGSPEASENDLELVARLAQPIELFCRDQRAERVFRGVVHGFEHGVPQAEPAR